MELIETIVIILILLLTVIIGRIFNKISSKYRNNNIPGPLKTHEKLGNLDQLKKFGSLQGYLDHLHSKYGPVVSFYWLNNKVVSLAHHEYFKCVNNLSDRPSIIFENFRALLGDENIQFCNGLEAKERRKCYDKYFQNPILSKYVKSLAIFGSDEITFINRDPSGLVKNVGKLCLKLASNAILGCCVTDIDGKLNQQSQDFVDLYEYVFYELEQRLIDGKIYQEEEEMKFNQQKSLFLSKLVEFIEHRKNLLIEHNQSDDQLLIDAMILFHGDAQQRTTLSDLLAMVIGGFHTTGNTLTWSLYFLAKHEDIQSRLYKEMQQHKLLDIQWDRVESGHETIRQINQCKYLRAIIDETLRLAQIAPYAARVSSEPIVLSDKFTIPPDTPIITALGVMEKSEYLFDDPELFQPERFIDKKLPMLSFVPFGFAGKRQCPGINFSYLELSVWLIQLVNEFQIDLANKSMPKPDQIFGLVTHMSVPLDLIFSKRK